MAYTTIDDPTAYFQAVTYTGNGATGRSIVLPSDTDMQPDWVWLKSRGEAEHHQLTDSVRGVNKQLYSHLTYAEATETDRITAFNSDGFTIQDDIIVNKNSIEFVAWCWKAGGSASSNSNGSITSSVSVSTDAGFSIVSYTGTGANATVGHGLGAAPAMIIQKNRIDAQPWWVYHSSIGAGGQLRLSGTDAEGSDGGVLWNSTAPTSTVFSLGDNGGANGSSDACIAYCFVEKKGYSKVGGYTGNGNADGPFVYTGFKPSFVMVKARGTTGNWTMFDNKRSPFNFVDNHLYANTSAAEQTASAGYIDFLSNGFKKTDTFNNASGQTYIYMAFAENPFVTSTGVPTTAR
jgi:hypothetical protein